jgi:hypothetical protein
MTVVAAGHGDLLSLKRKSPAVFGEAFLFLLSILRIPSLGIKPAKYLWISRLVSSAERGRTLSYRGRKV